MALVLVVLVVHMVVSDTHRRRRHRHHIQALELGAYHIQALELGGYCTTFAKSGVKNGTVRWLILERLLDGSVKRT